MDTKFIDLHCHSSTKPFSQSFDDISSQGKNTLKRVKRSIWFKTKLTAFNTIINSILTLTKFTQADFTSTYLGGGKVIMVSIDPMERELVLSKNKTKMRGSGRLLKNLIMGIGQNRITYLCNIDNYFNDLMNNLNFIKQLQGFKKEINGDQVTYKIVETFNEINLSENVIHIILTIEGAHALKSKVFSIINTQELEKDMLGNIDVLKTNVWGPTPFLVALAHHFPNKVCGHAESLTGIAKTAYDQELNSSQGITRLGYKIIDKLLDNSNGTKQILIDIKHMNLKSRLHYFQYLKTPKYANKNIPIVVSHGAVNNKRRPSQFNSEINFYNDDVIEVAKSGGVFGVQLDTRRLKKVSGTPRRRDYTMPKRKKRFFKRTYFIWRQIELMATLVYNNRAHIPELKTIDPWGFQTIGSDFDGIVDPLDGFWTHAEMPKLKHYLLLHAEAFLRTKKAKALPNYKALSAESIIEKFMFTNAYNFLQKHFNR